MYMATNDGKLVKWDEGYQDYDGEPIEAHWEMNFEDLLVFKIIFFGELLNELLYENIPFLNGGFIKIFKVLFWSFLLFFSLDLLLFKSFKNDK